MAEPTTPLLGASPGEEYDGGLENAVKRARADGFTVYQSDPKTILLDLDDLASIQRYETHRDFVTEKFGFEEAERWTSKGGFGTHVVLKSKEPHPSFLVRLLIQACLGSDPKRELLSYLKSDGAKEVSVLFRPPA